MESKNLILNFDNGVLKAIENKITGKTTRLVAGEEFVLSVKSEGEIKELPASAFAFEGFNEAKSAYMYRYSGNIDICAYVSYREWSDGNFKKSLEIEASDDLFLDFIDLGAYVFPEGIFTFSAPIVSERVLMPPYITTLGQPIYAADLFMGLEFPTADNRIENGVGKLRLYYGRTLGEIREGAVFKSDDCVIGAAIGDTPEKLRKSFFDYLKTVIRPERFRLQFNSWYDNMLDIDSEKIEKSFRAVGEGFRRAGLRPLDCYVVDDGWTDYKRAAFWEFDKKKFPDEFYKESALTKELNSTFGVWFGPRGGYTKETYKYAKRLKKLGYGVCKASRDICTGDPRYIRDLCARMAYFVKEFNVTYFKIDGFANMPCKDKKHNHPAGGYKDLYFYTFLWKEWVKGFELIRQADPDVFLNVTSYAHCSPWFLKWCDAIWINNAGDMSYEGGGSNLNQCLNYRDGRYKDFTDVRKLQFPVGYIYNHEPCYAERNYNPPLPSKSHKTVIYTDEEFARYLLCCMMRGSGFVECYFSPHMMDGDKWSIAAKVFDWAEKNFDILKNSVFFGGVPKKGEVYGYYAFNGKDAILMLRNPSDKNQTHGFSNVEHCFENTAYDITRFYPAQEETRGVGAGERIDIDLAPYSVKLFKIKLK